MKKNIQQRLMVFNSAHGVESAEIGLGCARQSILHIITLDEGAIIPAWKFGRFDVHIAVVVFTNACYVAEEKNFSSPMHWEDVAGSVMEGAVVADFDREQSIRPLHAG